MNLSKNEILEMTKRIISEERAKKQNITENRLLMKESDILKLVKESIGETLNESFYSKYLIDTLSSKLNADVEIDKEQKINPFYGGGTVEQISYKIILKNAINNIDKIILHGFTINGLFVDASIIGFSNGVGLIHSSLGILNYNSGVGSDEDIANRILKKLNN